MTFTLPRNSTLTAFIFFFLFFCACQTRIHVCVYRNSYLFHSDHQNIPPEDNIQSSVIFLLFSFPIFIFFSSCLHVCWIFQSSKQELFVFFQKKEIGNKTISANREIKKKRILFLFEHECVNTGHTWLLNQWRKNYRHPHDSFSLLKKKSIVVGGIFLLENKFRRVISFRQVIE